MQRFHHLGGIAAIPLNGWIWIEGRWA